MLQIGLLYNSTSQKAVFILPSSDKNMSLRQHEERDRSTYAYVHFRRSRCNGSNTGVIVGVSSVLLWWSRSWSAYWSGECTSNAVATTTQIQRLPPLARRANIWNDRELQQLRLDPHDIQDVEKLGCGSFGVVWLVRYIQQSCSPPNTW